MTKGFFSPSKRAPDSKYQWKYYGYAQQGQIYIKNDIKVGSEKSSEDRNNYHDKRPVV